MKKYFLVAASMLSVLAVNAQKDQLKAASKALKKGDAATAIQTLNPIAEVAKSAEDKTKADFFALYGQASLQLAQKYFDEQFAPYSLLFYSHLCVCSVDI